MTYKSCIRTFRLKTSKSIAFKSANNIPCWQEAERKEREKQESLVKGLDEAVKEREVQGRRNYAAEQEAAVQVRREEIRFSDLMLPVWLLSGGSTWPKTSPLAGSNLALLGRRTCWLEDWQGGELEKNRIQR